MVATETSVCAVGAGGGFENPVGDWVVTDTDVLSTVVVSTGEGDPVPAGGAEAEGLAHADARHSAVNQIPPFLNDVRERAVRLVTIRIELPP